jgi:16S rRNA (cytosine967-C5)-methyltransferase
MSISPARSAAFDILLRVEQQDSYASELLHSALCSDLSPQDQGLATEIVMGVLRWRSRLDSEIANASLQKLGKLDAEVLIALRIAAYQLGWLDRIPARAAIHESVELVKRSRKRSAAPLTNAVLRKLSASLTGLGPMVEKIESATSAEDLANAAAHPRWMVERWVAEFGQDLTRRVCRYDQAVPPTVIRLRPPAVEHMLRLEGVELEAGMFLADARRVLSGDVTKTKAFAERLVVIQDEASQLVAALVGKGSRILDCCAAPGGKTWAIADSNPGATIVAAELHSHRAELLRKRVTAPRLQVITADIRKLPVSERFDRVLVDVPCSGTGTLSRNPEIKWRLQLADLADLRSRQISILQSAMLHVAPGGRLIYSTCSMESEEDEEVVAEALRVNQAFRVLEMASELDRLYASGNLLTKEWNSLARGSFLRTIPGVQACDGFFVAILEAAG